MLFVESVDNLFGCQVIPLVNDDGFPSGPQLLKGGRNNNDKRSLKLHKTMCRSGLPPQYRCAIWITSVARVANPQLSISDIESYGTLAHAKNINAKWSHALGMTFPNPQDREDAIAPDFGLGQKMLHQLHYDYGEWNTTLTTTLPQHHSNKKSIPDYGVKALTGVLCVIHQVLGIEFCPPLPDIAAILLSHMPESYVFATIREMIDDTSHFLPVSQRDYYAWCKTYAFFVEKMFPYHYKLMKKCGVLDPTTGGLDPIFKRFFVTLLKREDLLRFMDVFVIEGGKAIFRLGLSMLHLMPKKAIGSLPITDSSTWWSEIRRRTHDRTFSFQAHLQLMFPKFETISKRYPRRSLLGRMNRFHEIWALEIMPMLIDETSPKPLGITSTSGCVIAKQANVRVNLAKWLPLSLQSTKLDLIYSTEKHGRSFVSFYNECHKTKNTVLLVEAINGNNSSTVGMFASHAWAINHHSIGDGNCFLFRIDPIPKCWYWTPDVHASTNLHDLESLAVREQFMIARSDFIAMGANREGTNGLRLDSDLSKGESHSAAGFDNESLAGQHHKTFDVGIVEVYQLVRDF